MHYKIKFTNSQIQSLLNINITNYLFSLLFLYIYIFAKLFTTMSSSSHRLSRLTLFLHVVLHPVFSRFLSLSLRNRFNCASFFFHSIILLKSTRLAVSHMEQKLNNVSQNQVSHFYAVPRSDRVESFRLFTCANYSVADNVWQNLG